MRFALAVVAVALGSGSAAADPVADAVARGETFGKQGDWSQAIDAFKAADKLAVRAKHACLIGLAYSRRELWAEAELFFALCHQRATETDALPDWLPEAESQLAQKLAASKAVAVTLRVDPPDSHATIAISSFAPDETLTPRVIHLAPGAHVITVTAPGYEPVKQEIVVVENAPREVRIALQRREPHSRVPLYVFGIAGVLTVGALAVEVLAVKPASDALDATYQYQYDAALDRYRDRRTLAVALVGGAAVTAAIGIVLRVVLDREPPLRIQAEAGHGGAAVLVEWSR